MTLEMRHRLLVYGLVALMGMIGASLRFCLEWVFADAAYPFGTFIINLFGCYVLEIVNGYVGRRLHVKAGLVRAMGVGLLGAFTTLSAFTQETLEFLLTGQWWAALVYVVLTYAGCFLTALAGHYTTRAMAARRLARLWKKRRRRVCAARPKEQEETS